MIKLGIIVLEGEKKGERECAAEEGLGVGDVSMTFILDKERERVPV